MRYSKKYKEDAEDIKAAGMPLPSEWLNPPAIEDPANEWLFEAFRRVSTCRSFGMCTGPIPITAIYTYCDREEVEDKEEFESVMLAMDDTYLQYLSEEREKDSK